MAQKVPHRAAAAEADCFGAKVAVAAACTEGARWWEALDRPWPTFLFRTTADRITMRYLASREPP
jgi:hypothetical protein